MKKKVLFVANIHKHFLAFHLPYLKWLKEQGVEVHVAASGCDTIVPYVDKQFDICFDRFPLKVKNIKAYRQLKKIIDSEQYDFVNCHTSICSAITRIASINARKIGSTKLLYTVHGFDFSKESNWKSWVLYYPIEKFLSRYTDAMITINQEDYEIILNNRFKNKETFRICGIGVNTRRLTTQNLVEKIKLRNDLGYNQNDFILIYVAEFIDRKNHKFIVDSLPTIVKIIPNVKILFAGKGMLMEKMKEYAVQKGVDVNIDFLGYRSDIGNLMAISDVGISSSKLEGLGLNIAEAMFTGLPVIASIDKGHKEMITHGYNGFLFSQGDHVQFVSFVTKLYNDPQMRNEMGNEAYQSIQKFGIDNVLLQMTSIYQKYL